VKRTILGGVAGGVVAFAWGALAHVILPIGDLGIRVLPNEEPLVAAMEDGITEPGFYFFPGFDMKGSDAAMKAWEAKYRAGPRGVIAYSPYGDKPSSPRRLAAQLAGDVAAGLVAAVVLSLVGGTFRRRLLAVTLMGCFAWLAISVPFWNWYCFPGDFTAGQAIDGIVAWFLGGLALARIVRPAAP